MIECQICKRQLGALSGKHLGAHGITAAEYRERFPGYDTREQKPVSEETRAKMRDSRTGYQHSDETKAKIGSKHKGKTRTPEEIDKWRASYAEYIAENGSPMLGKDRGDAFKKRMSDIAKARPPEMVQAKVEQMWAARRGQNLTEEQRVKYSEARLKFMQENPDKLGMKLFNTRPELDFEKILQDNGLTYKKSVPIGGKLYDFCVNENQIIEIDGPYHWNKNLYGKKSDPEELKIQGLARTQLRDELKTKIAIDHGYILYRIKVENSLPNDWIDQLRKQGCNLF